MTTAANVRAVGVCAAAAVAASTAWYTAFGRQLARYDETYAQGSPQPAWIMPVELARSAAVATAVAVLADRTRARGPIAAIHAGDWLVKLLLISALVGRRRAAKSAGRAAASTGRRQ